MQRKRRDRVRLGVGHRRRTTAVRRAGEARRSRRSDDQLECKTSAPLSDGSIHTVRFALRGDALEPAIEIEPQSSVLAPLAKATLERNEERLVLATTESSAPREPRAELTLFENSGFTRGFVKAAGGEYSNVYCTKR